MAVNNTRVDLATGVTGTLPVANGGTGQITAPAVQTKTANYTALTTDGYINCSGSAFTITLYAASGNAGKTITIKKTDSSLSNVITIDANASETIDGALTVTLQTQYESYVLYCDGSNWSIMTHLIPKIWTSFTGTITGSAVSGSIAYTANTLYWAREADSVHIQGNIRLGVVTTPPVGSTWINLPTSINFSSQAGASDGGRGPWGTTVGNISSVVQLINWVTITASGTNTMAFANGQGTQITFATGDELKVNFIVPVSGWTL